MAYVNYAFALRTKILCTIVQLLRRREYTIRSSFNSSSSVQLLYSVTMLISLTVGKVDAGVAVLLTEDKRLVKNPFILCAYSVDFILTYPDRVPVDTPSPFDLLGQHC
jgi:hypothetical protein